MKKRRIEDIAGEYIEKLINQVLLKLVKPDITLENVNQIDSLTLEQIKKEYGIEAIILDVDDTLRTNMRDIPKVNKEWINSLKGKVKIVILSNGIDRTVEKYFEENGIDYIGFAHKPFKKNFVKVCEKLQVNPENIMVVGNSLIDDIYGGKRNKMKTALVKKCEEER